jgi:hypothetical protein
MPNERPHPLQGRPQKSLFPFLATAPPSRSAGLTSICFTQERDQSRVSPGFQPCGPDQSPLLSGKNTGATFLPSHFFFYELRPGARNEPNRPFPGRSRRQSGTEHNPHKHRYLDLCRVLIMGHWFCRLHNCPLLSQSKSVSCLLTSANNIHLRFFSSLTQGLQP